MSEAPTTLGQLPRQRYRWSYGRMQHGVGKGVHPVEVMTGGPDQRWTLRTLTSAINARPSNKFGASMTAAQRPVLDTLADLTAISLERCALPPRELMLARIAALIAVDAPPASYMANAGAAADSGITGEDVQAIMIGIAPVVGTTKVVASAGNIFRALGFAIMVAEAEMAEGTDAEQ